MSRPPPDARPRLATARLTTARLATARLTTARATLVCAALVCAAPGCGALPLPDPSLHPPPLSLASARDPTLARHARVIAHLEVFAALTRRAEADPEATRALARTHFRALPPESWMLGGAVFDAPAAPAPSAARDAAPTPGALPPPPIAPLAHAHWSLRQALLRLAHVAPELARELAEVFHEWLEPPSLLSAPGAPLE